MQFDIHINAPAAKIWKTLFDDATYRQWAAEFDPGSHAVTTWEKGSKALFLGENQTGMVSEVTEHIPEKFLQITHKGIVKDGVEDLSSKEAQIWAGSMESYALSGDNNQHTLTVNLYGNAIPDEYLEMFREAWPKALDVVKTLAES